MLSGGADARAGKTRERGQRGLSKGSREPAPGKAREAAAEARRARGHQHRREGPRPRPPGCSFRGPRQETRRQQPPSGARARQRRAAETASGRRPDAVEGKEGCGVAGEEARRTPGRPRCQRDAGSWPRRQAAAGSGGGSGPAGSAQPCHGGRPAACGTGHGRGMGGAWGGPWGRTGRPTLLGDPVTLVLRKKEEEEGRREGARRLCEGNDHSPRKAPPRTTSGTKYGASQQSPRASPG